jgi:hypothetical protein
MMIGNLPEWSFMDLSNKPLDRWLCSEPLESRWLLSAGPPSFPGDHVEPAAVVELELEVAEEEPDEDVEISPADLPAAVLAAFNAAFPDAEISEAEREVDDGRTEYDVNAEVDGHELDVSLTPEGRIVEVEETLEDVPEAVLAWLREKFADAEIDEVSIVDDGGTIKYELAFTPAGDGPPMEATLGEAPVLATIAPPTGAARLNDQGATVAAAELLAPPESRPAIAEHAVSAPVAPPQEAQPNKPANAPAATPIAAAVLNLASNPAAHALQALAAGAGASVWLPQAADVMEHMSSIDVAAVERKLQGLLDEIESATTQTAKQTVSHGAIPLAVTAAVLAAAQLVIIRLRLPKGGPILLFNSINSSWSWILGHSGSERK